MRLGKTVRIGLFISMFLVVSLGGAIVVCAQEKSNDPCSDIRFIPLSNEAPTITVTDVRKLPQCVHQKFIRLVGIYRITFENSDFYDPTGEGGRTWITFDPYYSAVKRCSDRQAMRLLDREDGGTFGFVALGIFHGPELPTNVDPKLPPDLRERLEQTPRRYGHLGGWPNQFQVICVEKAVLLSNSGSVLEAQKPDARKRILEWYAKHNTP